MSEMDDPDAGAAAGSLPVPASLVKVQSYLRRIVPVLMEEGNETPELATQALEKALWDKNGEEAIKKFMTEPAARALLVARHNLENKDLDDSDPSKAGTGNSDGRGDGPTTGSAEGQGISYSIFTDVHYSTGKMSGLVVVKRGQVVEAEKPLNSQLRIMTLSEGSPYETLHDYVAAAVSLVSLCGIILSQKNLVWQSVK